MLKQSWIFFFNFFVLFIISELPISLWGTTSRLLEPRTGWVGNWLADMRIRFSDLPTALLHDTTFYCFNYNLACPNVT